MSANKAMPDVAQMAVDMVVRLGRECDRLERERNVAQAEVERLRDQFMEAVPLDTAVAGLVDTLVDYDVPTGNIIAKFRRLVADYTAEGGS